MWPAPHHRQPAAGQCRVRPQAATGQQTAVPMLSPLSPTPSGSQPVVEAEYQRHHTSSQWQTDRRFAALTVAAVVMHALLMRLLAVAKRPAGHVLPAGGSVPWAATLMTQEAVVTAAAAAVPALALALGALHRRRYLRWREALWTAHMVVLAAISVDSIMAPTAPANCGHQGRGVPCVVGGIARLAFIGARAHRVGVPVHRTSLERHSRAAQKGRCGIAGPRLQGQVTCRNCA